MMQRTRPKIWPTEKKTVVYLVPYKRSEEYAVIMHAMTVAAQNDLRWDDGSIELIGMVAATARHGTEGIFFLEEMGISTRSVSLLVLWGETAAAVEFEEAVPAECGVGKVVLPETGVVLPTVRMPSLEGGWWLDPLHQAYAVTTFTGLVKNGKDELDGTEPYVVIAGAYLWN